MWSVMSAGQRYESEDVSTSARQRGIVLEVARHVMRWYSDVPIGMDSNYDRVQIVKRCRKLGSVAVFGGGLCRPSDGSDCRRGSACIRSTPTSSQLTQISAACDSGAWWNTFFTTKPNLMSAPRDRLWTRLR
jgi:hypothetical protein